MKKLDWRAGVYCLVAGYFAWSAGMNMGYNKSSAEHAAAHKDDGIVLTSAREIPGNTNTPLRVRMNASFGERKVVIPDVGSLTESYAPETFSDSIIQLTHGVARWHEIPDLRIFNERSRLVDSLSVNNDGLETNYWVRLHPSVCEGGYGHEGPFVKQTTISLSPKYDVSE